MRRTREEKTFLPEAISLTSLSARDAKEPTHRVNPL